MSSSETFRPRCTKAWGAVVGGCIEIVHPQGLKPPYCMIVNDEGLLKKLPLNRAGSLLYGTQFHGSPIVGDIVIMAEGWTPEGPDIIGIPEERAEKVAQEFIKSFRLKGAEQ